MKLKSNQPKATAVQEESQGFVGSVAPFLGHIEKFTEPPGYEGSGWLLAGRRV